MPLYEYECQKCKNSFTAIQNMTDKHFKKCKKCGKFKLKRLINGGIGVIFKGPGFYCKDHPKKK